MKANFHTHTNRCKHASGCEEDYVSAALEKGLSMLGFSDHAPFPDKDFGLRMPYQELPDYLSEIDRLNEKYQDKIRLYKGLEIEYHPRYLSYYHELLTEMKLNYLALGEHMYTATDGSVKNICLAESTKDYIEYAENIAEGVASGLFAFIAHPDLMFRNAFAWDKNCSRACDIILTAAEKYAVPLEYNVNGLRRGISSFPDGTRYPYPHERFWKQLSGSRQPVLIGSDCHVPEQVYDDKVKLAEQLCAELQLNIIVRCKMRLEQNNRE